jgi:hypothetical protein
MDRTPFETGGLEYLHTFAAVEAAYKSVAARRCVELAEWALGKSLWHQ